MSTFNNVREHKDLAKRFRRASITCQESQEKDLTDSMIIRDNERLARLKLGYYICEADSEEEWKHDMETFFAARSTQEFYSLVIAQYPEDPIFCLSLVTQYAEMGTKYEEDEETLRRYEEWISPDIKF